MTSPGSFFRAVAKHEGRVWIGCGVGGLLRFDDGNGTLQQPYDPLASLGDDDGFEWDVRLLDARGALVVCCSRAVVQLSGGKLGKPRRFGSLERQLPKLGSLVQPERTPEQLSPVRGTM